ncbi:helix-turn-helix domain-containing protein [Actinocorallia aurea]
MSMPSGPGPVVQRAILTSELQRLRQEHGSTQDQVASALDWSLSKLIRIEGGSVGVSTTDLRALLRFYGLPDGAPAIDRLTELARDGRQRGWWALYRNDLSPAYLEFIGYEAGASTIRCLQPLAIPGLLQIEEYANALTVEFTRTHEVRDIIVEVRMQRQDQVLGRPDPPLLHVVLDEAALRRHVGGQIDAGIMARQLRHLIAMTDKPNIAIEVIPFTQGAHFGMQGEFTILGFDGRLGDVLFIENARSTDTNVADRDARITEYRVAFENLRRLTLAEEETVPFLERVIVDMGG